jgi:hypothetical protein
MFDDVFSLVIVESLMFHPPVTIYLTREKTVLLGFGTTGFWSLGVLDVGYRIFLRKYQGIQHLPTHDSPKSSYSNVTFHLISRSSSKSVCCVSIGQKMICIIFDYPDVGQGKWGKPSENTIFTKNVSHEKMFCSGGAQRIGNVQA